jgi:hypothetical protein
MCILLLLSAELRQLFMEKEQYVQQCSKLEVDMARIQYEKNARSLTVKASDKAGGLAGVLGELTLENERLKEEKDALERALAREKAALSAALERETVAFLSQRTSSNKEADHVATITAKVKMKFA